MFTLQKSTKHPNQTPPCHDYATFRRRLQKHEGVMCDLHLEIAPASVLTPPFRVKGAERCALGNRSFQNLLATANHLC
jgi:hypothetical protein